MREVKIRPESPNDILTIQTVNTAAFGQPNEAQLVNKLRENATHFIPELSLVALMNNEIVGHILLTTNKIVDATGNEVESLSLAPMAVAPFLQKKGIGSQLVQHAIEKAKQLGYHSIIVLGHEKYYPKFGFKPASTFGIKAPFEVPDDVFMALELTTDALKNVAGMVHYPHEFMEV
ncbi:GNAT family N-acetyltransferase [Sphingobacterium psychroaquaticum]|uniref:Predicted N-acetyltransferase YhbS n=1 Tax=Sphingobacterium psychroaquaticum TaxID=561061 RepID=A0A1X7JTV2_9SPHI|nr:N-acetyltransferase [Sphingobacterium psychroaquaticum]SMG31610.1 Predicted N-acetyltransferase YhbS [Sphingobacterium psychroaquaticum]